MATNIRVSNTPIYTGINCEGLPSEVKRKVHCDQCGQTIDVPSSYNHIYSDFDKAEFCSFNCRFAYYKANAKVREHYLYTHSYEYQEMKKKDSQKRYIGSRKEKIKQASKEYDRRKRKERKEKRVYFRDFEFMKLRKYDRIVLFTSKPSSRVVYIDCPQKDFIITLLNYKRMKSLLGRAIVSEKMIEQENEKIYEIELSYTNYLAQEEKNESK